MKKILASILSLALVMCMSVSAFAADNDNKTVEIAYGVNDSYTVTIPDSMKVGTDATVSVSDVVIGYGKQLTVAVSSTNEWKLKNNDDSLSYTVKIGDTTVSNKDTVLTVAAGTTTKQEVTLSTALTADQKAKYAGSYTDTLTFSVNVADITINATAMTQDELKTAVAAKLTAGNTDLDITLSAGAGYAMFTAIHEALSESDAANGSINLTLKGVTNVGMGLAVTYTDDAGSAGGMSGYSYSIVDKLHSISLPDATEIEHNAFYGCTSLVSVDAPKVTSVGEEAFGGCTSLTSVNAPKVTSVGSNAFDSCTSLASIDLPEATSIGTYAFQSNTALTSISLPKATSIKNNTFSGCTSLTSLDLPSVTNINRRFIYDCSAMTTLKLTAKGTITVATDANTNLNAFDNAPTENIDLYLNSDKQSEVSGNTWQGYTFKSITFVDE